MRAWRICLALAILLGSDLATLRTIGWSKGTEVKVAVWFFGSIAGIVALTLAQDDGSARKEVDPAREADIRHEARKRCLDEIWAIALGEDIDKVVGVDVARAYHLTMLGMKKKGD
jgi:hypothetical protein